VSLYQVFFSANELKELENNCRFNMQRIIVNYNNGQTLIPIGCLSLNFHTFDHKQNDKSILDYVSTNLKGFFSIMFHYENKVMRLENIREYLGNARMVELMIYYLISDEVQSKIRTLINNIA